jgi:hypothetical protein
MPQQTVSRIDTSVEEATSVMPFWKIPQSSADVFAPAKNSWSRWNSAQFGKVDMPMMKTPDEITEMNQKAMEAFSRSSAALAEGLKEVGQCVLNFGQNSFAAYCSAGQEMSNAKSLQEVFALQSKWARHFFNAVTSEAAKFREMTSRIANNAAEPIQKHVGATFGESSD